MDEVDLAKVENATPCQPQIGVPPSVCLPHDEPRIIQTHKFQRSRSFCGLLLYGLVGRSICYASVHFWWHKMFADVESLFNRHYWKVLCSVLLLGLFCLGLKLVVMDTDFDNLWVEKNDRLISEWQYVASALQRVGLHTTYADQQHYFQSPDVRRSRLLFMNMGRSRVSSITESDMLLSNPSSGPSSVHTNADFSTGFPGHEYMGTMETVIQTSTKSSDILHSFSDGVENSLNLLTPVALLDHMEFLIKVRRLQITVGSSKWSFKDLCQRVSLPFGAEMHHIQAYLDMISPCLIITPLDCFWEGAKVLGPEEAMWVPWFDERTLVQWTNIDPVGLLNDLRERYGNHSHAEVSTLIRLFQAAGIDHGYLNRSCLDPSDPACPISSPNHHGQPPDVARALTGGCPGFASKMLHWSEKLIVGGRRYDSAASNLTDVHRTDHTYSAMLVGANSLQSLIMLRSPRDLYEAVRITDPYKHESWSVADAQHVLDEWRRSLRRLVAEHNAGLHPNNAWTFCAFTDNSLRDLLRELTLRLGPVKIAGCVLLLTLYSLVCLLDWRDPIRSQCWLALAGLVSVVISGIAGLGMCAAFGLSFNLLTIQVIPFLLMGLGVHGIFTLSTCYHCCISRRIIRSSRWPKTSFVPWPSTSSIVTYVSTSTCSAYSDSSISRSLLILAEHGPSLLFGTISISASFFCAAYIPIPLMRQFCLQAGTLTLVQSLSLIFIFPMLLKLDGIRRAHRRLDVLCCLKQQSAETGKSCGYRGQLHRSPSVEIPASRCSSHGYTDFSRSRRSKCFSKLDRSHVHREPLADPSCPSIRINVTNHVSENQSSDSSPNSASNPSCSTMYKQSIQSGHTIHTTVTVSSTPSKPTNFSFSDFDAEPKERQERPESKLHKKGRAPRTFSKAATFNGACASRTHRFGRDLSPGKALNLPLTRRPLLVRFARRLALLLTMHWAVQLFICAISLVCFVVVGILTAHCLPLGLDWSTLIPNDAVEYGFAKISQRDFGLRNFQIIARGSDLSGSRSSLESASFFRSHALDTSSPKFVHGFHIRPKISSAVVGRGIDFPMQQRQLHQLYARLVRLPGVFLAGRRYWLEAMRDWLQQVQHAFDSDRRRGLISSNGHWSSNASELGILGLQLIVQTDRGPELSRIGAGRLVRNGIVDPPAFYTLFHAWRSYDALNFSSLACTVYPEPTNIHTNYVRVSPRSGRPSDLPSLPPAEPVEFVQTNFYAVGIRQTEDQLKLVQDIRFLTESMTAQGVPVFPIGDLFTFVENFLYLARETAIALGIFFAILLVASLVLFCSPVTSCLLLVFGAGGGLCAALCGLCLLGLELNPISSVLLLFCSGWGARLSVGFLSCWPAAHHNSSVADLTHHSLNPKQFRLPREDGRILSVFVEHDFPNVGTPDVDILQAVTSSSDCSGRRASTPASISLRKVRSCLTTGIQVRQQLIRTLSNHFSTMFHSTVSLLLAIALLAAARVQFIVDYFFWLIAVVGLLCLYNSICVIPTVCCLLYPIHQFFNPNLSVQHSKWATATNRRTTQSAVVSDSPVTFCDSTSSRQDRSVPSTSPLATPSSSPCQTSVHPVVTVVSESHTNLPAVSTTTRSQPSITSASSPFTRPQLSNYTNIELLDLCKQQLRSFPNDYTTALVVAVATAASANTVRSRPASLSTISEEPSHSNSTVSLNHPNPLNSAVGSAQESSSNSDNALFHRTIHTDNRGSDLTPADLLHLVGLLNLANPLEEVGGQLGEPPSSSTSLAVSPIAFSKGTNSYTRTTMANRAPKAKHASPPPSYTSVIHEILRPGIQSFELPSLSSSYSDSPGVLPRMRRSLDDPAFTDQTLLSNNGHLGPRMQRGSNFSTPLVFPRTPETNRNQIPSRPTVVHQTVNSAPSRHSAETRRLDRQSRSRHLTAHPSTALREVRYSS